MGRTPIEREEIERIRRPEVLRRIAEYSAMGFDNNLISEKIKDEFKFLAKPNSIQSVIKQYSVTGTMFLNSEKEIATLFKESIISLLEESKENVKTLSEIRDELKSIISIVKTNQLLEGSEAKKYKEYINEIKDIIKTLDNSLSTQKGILELVDRQKKEIKMSTVQSTQMTMEVLEELEDAGMIIISPELKEKEKKKKIEIEN